MRLIGFHVSSQVDDATDDEGKVQCSRLPEDILCPDDLDVELGKRGYRAAVEFVQRTLDGLAAGESQDESTSVFARVTVGIARDAKTKRLDYFVEDISRTLSTTWYAHVGAEGKVGDAMEELFHVLMERARMDLHDVRARK